MGSYDSHVVHTEHLTKRYGKLLAVDDLNLDVYKGEVFGFLGPNGSGKSTTIGMMLGLIAPTSGTVELFGSVRKSDLPRVLRRIGAVTESAVFYPYLSGRDNLEYFSRITHRRRVSSKRIAEVIELVELEERQKDRFGTYSLGMKQRLAIACALLNNPEFVILDEPTNGLDPAGMKSIRELIVKLGNEGKTIFLNSHLLHEVEQVCKRVAIIKKGKLVAQGLVSDLLGKGDVLQIAVSDPARAVDVLKNVEWIKSVTGEGDRLLVCLEPDKNAELSAVLAGEKIFVTEMKAQEHTLEEYFLEMTGEQTNA
jgi:ABC-2 type transport system ATP-binding protein